MEEYMLGPKINWIPTEKRELKLGLGMALIGLFLGNTVIYGGWNLGYAIGQVVATVALWWYLRSLGHRGSWYTNALLGLSLVIAAGFGWSADGAVKLMMVPFLLAAINMAFCQMTGKSRYGAGSARSLLDGWRTYWSFGFGKIGQALRGMGVYLRSQNSWAQNGGAVLVGIGIAVPLLLVVVPLLMSADAAFAGLMDLIPELDVEFLTSLMFGVGAALFLYSRAVSLGRGEEEACTRRPPFTIHVWTVNTALGAVCMVYLAYLFSQLAYFVGGFAGILPEGYTAAEYARRGFFEMTCLSAINLGLMAFGNAGGRAGAGTRMLCLFLALVSEFLVAASVAKMLLYIDSYGLTRLRVLTMVVMAFLGVTTALVGVWLFAPKVQYMKTVMVLGLAIGAGLLWVDVDAQVANYNVDAYLDGRLSQVDLDYLEELGPGAVEALIRLDDAPTYHADVEKSIRSIICWYDVEDWRGMNWTTRRTLSRCLERYPHLAAYLDLWQNWLEAEEVAQAVLEAGAVTEDTVWPGYELILHEKEEQRAVEFRARQTYADGVQYGFCYFSKYSPFNCFSNGPITLRQGYYYCATGTRKIYLEQCVDLFYWYRME